LGLVNAGRFCHYLKNRKKSKLVPDVDLAIEMTELPRFNTASSKLALDHQLISEQKTTNKSSASLSEDAVDPSETENLLHGNGMFGSPVSQWLDLQGRYNEDSDYRSSEEYIGDQAVPADNHSVH
jgi:hypothetical protein